MMGTHEAVHSLRSTQCPACRSNKKPWRSVCYKCWKKLNPDTRENLYLGVGEGYEEAIDKAIQELTT